MNPARSAASFLRRISLKDVLFLTVPALGLLVYVVGSACLDYRRMLNFDDWWAAEASVEKYLEQRLGKLRKLPQAIALSNLIPITDDLRETIRIEVDPRAWDEVASDVAARGDDWVEATLVRGDRYQPIRMRLRGDSSLHWTTSKKSLTLRMDRDDLHKGFRDIGLSLKTVLPQFLANSLAPDFGLLGHETAVAPLFINGRYSGIFRFLEPISESFLRRNRRMPGNVFRGDCASRGELFEGVPRGVFTNPNIWDRVASNDRPGTDPRAGLTEFIADLNQSTLEGHKQLMSRLDRAELSRLLALLLTSGDPYHMSGVHNQLWYEDPSSGLLHPIVWDLRVFGPSGGPGENLWEEVRFINHFWLAVLRDPRVFDGALDYLSERLVDDELLQLATERVERVFERYRPHFAFDLLRRGAISAVGQPRFVIASIRANLETVAGWVQDSRASFGWEPAAEGYTTIDLVSGGRSGCALDGFELAEVPGEAPELWADANRNGSLDSGDRRVPAALERDVDPASLRLATPEPLLSGCSASGPDFVAEPLHYRYFLTPGADLTGVHLRGRFSGAALEPAALATGAALPEARSWHPWDLAEPAGRAIAFAGEVALSADFNGGERDEITLAPGTRIALAPGVSFLSRGRVTARGTEDRPILVEGADPDAPWGTWALQGPGASGSVFEHVRFSGGSGAMLERVEYKGMVSVHNARGVSFDECEFADNRRCDDLLNVVRAEVDLTSCDFDDANADAIDYDISSGEITGCTIRDSANDGIDLMTSSPRIVSTRILDSGDKGISAGEDSSPLVFDCELRGCKRGLEIKDYSAPMILRSTIEGNDVGILQQKKNWRYGGSGRAKLVGSVVQSIVTDYEGLDGARLTALAARIGPQATGGEPGAPTRWVEGRYGIDCDPAAPGRPERWRPAPAWEVVDSEQFQEDFEQLRGAWRSSAGVRRLAIEDRDLVAVLGSGAGTLGRPVDWDLDATRKHHLVLEVAGEGLSECQVHLISADSRTTGSFAFGSPSEGTPRRGKNAPRYLELEVPPGHHRALEVVAAPSGRGGRFVLQSWVLLAEPRREP